MAVIPVKLKTRDNDQSVLTYAFLDNGGNSSFCSESLVKQLGVNGHQVKISLSTLEKKKITSPTASWFATLCPI